MTLFLISLKAEALERGSYMISGNSVVVWTAIEMEDLTSKKSKSL